MGRVPFDPGRRRDLHLRLSAALGPGSVRWSGVVRRSAHVVLLAGLLLGLPVARSQPAAEGFVGDGPRVFLALPGRGATVVLLLASEGSSGQRRFVVLEREGAAPESGLPRVVEVPAGARRVEVGEVPDGLLSARLFVDRGEGELALEVARIPLTVRALAFDPPLAGPPPLYGSEGGTPFVVARGTRLVLPEGVVCAVGGDVGVHAPVIASADDRLVCRDEEGRDVPAPPIGLVLAPDFPPTVAASVDRRFAEANAQMLGASALSPEVVSLCAPTPDRAQLAAITGGLAYLPVKGGADVVRTSVAADVSFLDGRYSLTLAMPIATGGATDSSLRLGSGDLFVLGTAELLERGRARVRVDAGSFLPTDRGPSGIGHARVLSSVHVTGALGERHLLRMRQAGVVAATSGGPAFLASAYGWDVRLSREDRWSLGVELDTSFGREGGSAATLVSSLAAVTLAFDVVQLWLGGRVALTNDAERALGRGALLFGLRAAAF